MTKNDCRYSLRINKDILAKLKSISEYEGLTLNAQLNIIIRRFIKEYEKENGEVHVSIKETAL